MDCENGCSKRWVDGFSLAEFWANDILVVAISGDLDMLTAPDVMTAIRLAGHSGSAAVVVDLTGVTFLSAAGMNLLVDAHRETRSARRFVVVADGSATSRPLRLMGIDTLVTLYRTLDEALVGLA